MAVKTFAIWDIEYIATFEQSGEEQFAESVCLALDESIDDAELAIHQLRAALIGTSQNVYAFNCVDEDDPPVIGTEKLLSICVLSVDRRDDTIDLIVPELT